MIYIIVIIVLIITSAFFSASETAFSCVPRIRIKSLAENGSKRAVTAMRVIENYDKTLTTILVGNNIVNICSATIGTIFFTMHFKNGALISTVVITLVVLIFGEILPKSFAKDYSEHICLAVGGILYFFMVILSPITFIFVLLKKLASKIFSKKQTGVSVTEQELIAIIDEIKDEGVLEEQEGNLVRSALEFDEITVDTIITPRVDVVAVDINWDTERIKTIFLEEQFSRLPVYEKSIDNIIGTINSKDFFRHYVENESISISDMVQNTLYVSNFQKLSEILHKMQKEKIHMAIVLDQYGGTLGIVTLEDVIEQLVGEIYDEGDDVVNQIEVCGNGQVEVNCDMSFSELEEFLGTFGITPQLQTDAKTVAGWVLELFGRIPKCGDRITWEGICVEVLVVDENRVVKVKLELNEEKDLVTENVVKGVVKDESDAEEPNV